MSKLPVYFVGLGIFGTFIAQDFQRQGHPVKGYDNGDNAAASRGVNVRTIRGDYSDPEEFRIAYDCRNNWEEKQKQYFTKPGRWVAYHHDDPTIENINKARKIIGFEERPINSPEALERLRRVFGLDIVAKNGKVVLNEDDGLIDLAKILQDARTSIPHHKTNVQKLIYSPDLRKITGIEISGGECVDTSEAFVFITAGAWTPKLLHYAGIPYTREIPRAVGLFSFPVYLTKEHASKLKGEPALSLIGDGMLLAYVLYQETDISTGQFTAPLGDKLIGWVTWVKRPFLVHDPSDKSIDYSVSHYAARAKLEVWRWLQLSSDFHGEQIGLPQFNLLVVLHFFIGPSH